MRTLALASLAVPLLVLSTASAGQAPAFTAKPEATRVANGSPTTTKVRISFAVDCPTDVAVYIEDSKGKIVRHLVAGVLGKNPPPPLVPGLSQTIEWDGKADFGRPAGPGPFRVRVALGLSARYDKVLMADYQRLTGVKNLMVGPDGTLYVQSNAGSPSWYFNQTLAYDRQGRYVRTVTPWPSGMKKEQVEGFNVLDLDGRPAPLVQYAQGVCFYPARSSIPAAVVSSKGPIYQLAGGTRGAGDPAVIALGSDGSCPLKPFRGPALMKKTRWGSRPALALASGEQHLYVAGFASKKGTLPAVYRVKLPERAPLERFFGDPGSPGGGKTQLGEPRGMAADGRGNLLIADYANDRVVVVSEAEGKYVGEMKVEKPDCIAVDRKSGTVYVSCAVGSGRPGKIPKGQLPGGSCRIVKYSGWENPKVVANMTVRGTGYSHRGYTMAVDTSAKPAIIWAGGHPGLLRIEDLGARFSDAEKPIRMTGRIEDNSYVDLLVDHVKEQIYARSGKLASGPAGTYQWFRFDERTSEFKTVGGYTSQGSQLGVGPDGTMYLSGYSCNLFKYTADGKASPWTKRNTPPDPKNSRWSPRQAHNMYVPVSMCWTNHTMSVGYDGHIYTFESRRSGGRTTKKLCEYLPSGEKVKRDPVIWKVSDACTGPKFDQQGNIYIIDQLKPKGQLYPPEFEKVMAGNCTAAKAAIPAMYGGVLKFSPRGGMIDGKARHLEPNPFDGSPRLPKGLKTIEAETCTQGRHGSTGRTSPAKVIGAEWVHMGVSHVDICHCNCQTTRFDVDLFGRVWYPDLNLFRVGVLDTNGNVITRFGGYGNAESRGPDSKDKSLAKPDIAFAWLIGVGATDKYAYMGDCLNRRMLRATLVYAAEEVAAVH